MSEKVYKIVFDKKAMRPGCVILQALYGGDKAICHLFLNWTTDPSPDLIGVQGTLAEFKTLAKICNQPAASTLVGNNTEDTVQS